MTFTALDSMGKTSLMLHLNPKPFVFVISNLTLMMFYPLDLKMWKTFVILLYNYSVILIALLYISSATFIKFILAIIEVFNLIKSLNSS